MDEKRKNETREEKKRFLWESIFVLVLVRIALGRLFQNSDCNLYLFTRV